ncbi:MAG: hypothetical protein QOH88_884 [Verrucomicrobiota bacterium]
MLGLAPLPAATPASGTLQPTPGTKLDWDGFPATLPAGGLAGEQACVDGTNCDVFTIHVGGAKTDWAGKSIVIKITFPLGDDADLYIHKNAKDGQAVTSGQNGGPTDGDGVSETASVNPATSGVGDYVVHVLYSSFVPGDKYHGTATVVSASGPDAAKTRTATYITGGITFSPNAALKSPANLTDAEPSNRTDFQGNFYTGGIRGFPAGVDLWYFDLRPQVNGSPNATYDPNMRLPIYRGQPDGFSPNSAADLGGDGGGDIDLAVGFALPAGQTNPTLAFSSLIVANLSTGKSVDRAQSYNRNPAGNLPGGPAADDRQWHEFLGANSVYMFYRTAQPAISQIQRSDDGGFTYGPTTTAGSIGQTGSVDVHQATGVVYGSGASGLVAVGIPPAAGLPPVQYNTYQAASDPNGLDHKFFEVKVADDGTPNGTVYVCYSNDTDIYVKHSTDQGKTWADPVKVNGGNIDSKVNIFPWMETGPTPGSIGVVWYGTSNPVNNDAAEWKVYFAQSFNANTTAPTFRVAEVTEPEHVIHASNISENGLDPTGSGVNRNLLDYFQMSFDPTGAAVVAYADDHNDFYGNMFSARQVTGPSIKTGQPLPAPAEGSGLVLPATTSTVSAADAFPPRQPGFNGEQVTDFSEDVTNAVLTRIHAPDAVDIQSIRYDTSGTGDTLAIAAAIKVSDLSSIPAAGQWRASFAVNSPHSVLSADGTYTYGASDHGDQFYLQASTSAQGTQTFTYGKAVRESSGSVTYTSLGAADKGMFNQDDNTISIQVAVKKLNTVLATAGHPGIGNGTVVTGLRGHSSSAATSAARGDDTLGGTQFTVHDSAFPAPAPYPEPTPLPLAAVAPGATPVPTPPASNLANIATRVSVTPGNNGAAGFIKRTSATKRVLIRGTGPSLTGLVPGPLADPAIDILDANNVVIASNDNWRGPQEAEITSTGLAPKSDNEAAVILNLRGTGATNNFTAVLKGAAGSQGVGVIEVYDLDATSFADLGNVSTRGLVGTFDNVLIGGLIIRDSSQRNQSQTVVVRGIGPSLTSAGITFPLQDPLIELRNAQGVLIEANDDWASASQASTIPAVLKPSNSKESAIKQTLSPGNYTVVLRGVDNGVGTGVVEAYNLGNQ